MRIKSKAADLVLVLRHDKCVLVYLDRRISGFLGRPISALARSLPLCPDPSDHTLQFSPKAGWL